MNKSLESKNQRQASLAQQTDSWMTGRVPRSHSGTDRALKGTSKNVGEAASARQKQAKKRSLRVVNEHLIRFAPPLRGRAKARQPSAVSLFLTPRWQRR